MNQDHLFTFADTNVQVKIKKVSPLLMMELQKRFPPPKPPLNEVDYGDGIKRKEPNLADPDYAAALIGYQQDSEYRLRRLIIQRGLDFALTEDFQAQVNELRTFWKNEFESELPGDDREVFISFIAIGSDADLMDLVNAVLRRSQPTEAAIEEATNSFPGAV